MVISTAQSQGHSRADLKTDGVLHHGDGIGKLVKCRDRLYIAFALSLSLSPSIRLLQPV